VHTEAWAVLILFHKPRHQGLKHWAVRCVRVPAEASASIW
jgi:hypothetical protein